MAMDQAAISQMIVNAITEFRIQNLDPNVNLLQTEIANLRTLTGENVNALTAEINTLKSNMRDVRSAFDVIDQNHSAKLADADNEFKKHIVNADLEFTKMTQKMAEDFNKHDDLFKKVDELVKSMQIEIAQVKSDSEHRRQQAEADAGTRDNLYQQFQAEVQHSNQLMQGSLSAAINAATSHAGGTGGARSTKTLDEDRRLEGITQLTGHESLAEVTEWYSKVHIKLESACPGSGEILAWVTSQSEEVTTTLIDSERHADRLTAHRLNRELVSWMANVIKGKAWTFAKPCKKGNGLEAWRLVHKSVTMQGPQQVQQEYKYLLKPAGPTKIEQLTEWMNEWEDRADKLAISSSVHAFPDELRRNIFFESMPKSVQDQVEAERRKGHLLSHIDTKNWLHSLCTQTSLSVSKSPPPLLLHNVHDQAPEQEAEKYSVEEWQQYEAAQALEQAHAEHVQSQINSLAKGKGKGWDQPGKGKGWESSGKGKGKSGGKGFQGNCWLCNKFGHSQRDCPEKGKGKGDKGKGKGKGKLYALDEREDWALCMTCAPCDSALEEYLDAHHGTESKSILKLSTASADKYSQWQDEVQSMISKHGRGTSMPKLHQQGSMTRTEVYDENGHLTCCIGQTCEQCIDDNDDGPPLEKFRAPKRTVRFADMNPATDKAVAKLSRYDVLSTESDFVASIHEYPNIAHSLAAISPKPSRPKAQGKSKDDKALDQLVRSIQSNRIKVNLSKKLQASLDSIDDPIESKSEKQDVPHKPSPTLVKEKLSKIDNVLIVAKHIADLEGLNKSVSAKKILEGIDLVHVENEMSNHSLGSCCTIGRSSLKKGNSKIPNSEPSNSESTIEEAVSKEILFQTGHSLFVLTEQPPELNAVTNGKKMVWVQISTVLDSGAVRHVTPNGVFSLTVAESERSKEGHNYYGPAGEPIKNLGTQTVQATSNSGQHLSVGFDVARITRPLTSVSEIVKKNYRVVFDDEGSYVQSKKTGSSIDIRQEGSLYYLDLWVQVPEELSTSPFVRQVS